jgi:septum site-determining protein MinC
MITLKSSGDGLTIVLGEGPWSNILAELAVELGNPRSAEIFRGTRIRVETGERALTPLELEKLEWLLELYNVKFDWGSNGTQAHLPGLYPAPQSEPPLTNIAEWDRAALCPRTLRSGQVIRYAGHVFVMGDVNPGAYIVATGNVLVWGRLRGMVHAGASGNDQAVVCALSLTPTQLRIGKHIARAPDERSTLQPLPEMARVRDARIIIESWNSKERD